MGWNTKLSLGFQRNPVPQTEQELGAPWCVTDISSSKPLHFSPSVVTTGAP